MLTGQEGERLPELQAVTAISRETDREKQRRWLSLGDGQVGQEEERIVIDYTSDNRLPADAVRLRFSEANSMIRASVQSRPDAKSPWVSRCSAVFYSLSRGGVTISDEVCSFGRTSDNRWRLEIFEDGLGLEQPGRAPSLELGWTAAELLFVARGPAPFTLAFGSGRLERGCGAAGCGHDPPGRLRQRGGAACQTCVSWREDRARRQGRAEQTATASAVEKMAALGGSLPRGRSVGPYGEATAAGDAQRGLIPSCRQAPRPAVILLPDHCVLPSRRQLLSAHEKRRFHPAQPGPGAGPDRRRKDLSKYIFLSFLRIC